MTVVRCCRPCHPRRNTDRFRWIFQKSFVFFADHESVRLPPASDSCHGAEPYPV